MSVLVFAGSDFPARCRRLCNSLRTCSYSFFFFFFFPTIESSVVAIFCAIDGLEVGVNQG